MRLSLIHIFADKVNDSRYDGTFTTVYRGNWSTAGPVSYTHLGLYGVLAMSPIANPYNANGTLKRTVKYNSQDESFVLTRGVVDELEDSWLSKTEGFGTYNNCLLYTSSFLFSIGIK